MPLIEGRLERKSYYQAKVRGFCDSLDFCLFADFTGISIVQYFNRNPTIETFNADVVTKEKG
jgi:hypothetical protein